MYFSHRQIIKFSAISLLLCLCAPVSASGERHEQKVTDLAYGTSLYYLFQDQKLRAITELGVAKQRQTLKNQPDDAELLLGGLYFEYGLPEDSEQILTRLLNEKTDAATTNRVWFNLARVQYEKNNYKQAEELLARISEQLPASREAQKNYMLSNVYINNQQFDQAAKMTSLIRPESNWSAFSQYNLGVALTNTEQLLQGQLWLTKLISRQTEEAELHSLQDAARLLLGLNALRKNLPDESIKYLSNIQADGAFTNRALLATGWAWSKLSNPRKALTYWLTLAEREQHDGATLEAYLAIANAYEQLDNKPLAIQHYELALLKFDASLNKLDEAVESIVNMELVNTLYSENINKPGIQNTIAESLPEYIATPYLHQVFASKDFQQTLLNYKELIEIHNALISWKSNLPTLQLMLLERINSFENKRQLIAQTSDFTQLKNLQQQRDLLALKVRRIKQNSDYYALANEDEIDYLEQLEDLKVVFEKLQNQHDLTEEKEKFRIMSGLLQWNISTDYPRRYWSLQHQLQLLDRALKQSTKSAASLQQASKINVVKLNDFKQRISGQGSEIERMEINASQLIEQQEQLINLQALEALEKRQQHVAQLKLSARYSLTRLYDELSKLRSAQ